MSTNERNTKLDGLRGLLSLIVALNHSFLVVAIPGFANVWGQNYLQFHDLQSKLQQILMILGNGGVAVTLFFILSGLVLGHSLSRTEFTTKGLFAFIVKRMLRLYPAYAFVIVLSAIYMKIGYHYTVFPAAASWFNWWMNFDMTFTEFMKNLLFISTTLGGVMWTLRVIVIASLAFPAFYLLNKRTSAFTDILITALLVWCDFTIFDIPGFRDLRYLFMFYAGLSLPKFQYFFSSISPKLISIFIIPAITFMFVIRYATDEYIGGVYETIVGWFVIGFMVYNRTKIFDFLNSAIMLFFGKISYSLYLIHFSILYILARLMFIYLPNLPYQENYLLIHSTLLIVSLAIATVVSMIVHRYIEEPSVRLSKLANSKINGE